MQIFSHHLSPAIPKWCLNNLSTTLNMHRVQENLQNYEKLQIIFMEERVLDKLMSSIMKRQFRSLHVHRKRRRNIEINLMIPTCQLNVCFFQDLDTQSSHSSLVIFHLKKSKEESSLSSLSSLVIFVSSLAFSCKKRDFMRKMVQIYIPFVLIELPNIILSKYNFFPILQCVKTENFTINSKFMLNHLF